MEEPPPRPESAIRPRTWKSCCLVPALAIGAVLLIVGGASLFNGRTTQKRPARSPAPAVSTREDFVRFGRQFFAISEKADHVSEEAFKTLESAVRGQGSLDAVHSSFREASVANSQAAEDFKALDIPASLRSQSKLKLSTEAMSRAYNARKLACDTLVQWNGDLADQQTADKYRRQVEDINRLTQEGLGYLADAANDNGVTEEDARQFLPNAILPEKNLFDAYRVPWVLLSFFPVDHSLPTHMPV